MTTIKQNLTKDKTLISMGGAKLAPQLHNLQRLTLTPTLYFLTTSLRETISKYLMEFIHKISSLRAKAISFVASKPKQCADKSTTNLDFVTAKEGCDEIQSEEIQSEEIQSEEIQSEEIQSMASLALFLLGAKDKVLQLALVARDFFTPPVIPPVIPPDDPANGVGWLYRIGQYILNRVPGHNNINQASVTATVLLLAALVVITTCGIAIANSTKPAVGGYDLQDLKQLFEATQKEVLPVVLKGESPAALLLANLISWGIPCLCIAAGLAVLIWFLRSLNSNSNLVMQQNNQRQNNQNQIPSNYNYNQKQIPYFNSNSNSEHGDVGVEFQSSEAEHWKEMQRMTTERNREDDKRNDARNREQDKRNDARDRRSAEQNDERDRRSAEQTEALAEALVKLHSSQVLSSRPQTARKSKKPS